MGVNKEPIEKSEKEEEEEDMPELENEVEIGRPMHPYETDGPVIYVEQLSPEESENGQGWRLYADGAGENQEVTDRLERMQSTDWGRIIRQLEAEVKERKRKEEEENAFEGLRHLFTEK